MRVARMLINWHDISAMPYPKKFPNGAFHWVNDASIARCLLDKRFEDVSIDCNRQPGVHNHAARIATLIAMIRSGVELKRLHLHITRKHINIEDGNHRFRAYQYLDMTDSMRAYVTGITSVLTMSSEWQSDWFWHSGRLSQVRELSR